jgi:hypothetical protein
MTWPLHADQQFLHQLLVTDLISCPVPGCCLALIIHLWRHEGITEPQVKGLDQEACIQLQCCHQQAHLQRPTPAYGIP